MPVVHVIGHGIDLANNERMRNLLENFGDVTLERQFTAHECAAAPAKRATVIRALTSATF